MSKILFFVLVLFFVTISFQEVKSQDIESQHYQENSFAEEFILTKQDSVLAASVPKLKLPDKYKNRAGKDLPSVVNNTERPYFRPIFSQETNANCGQSSGIAYNFTYEIDRARGVPADTAINQYTPQFTWNFMNGGDGYYGVSYFHSFEILKDVGNPTVADYGGMFYGGKTRWMSGYELYRHAMQNRIDGVYSIDVSTIEGVQTLKYWLYDHLEGDSCGGIASFYTYSAWDLKTLPSGTPEAGKRVITTWRAPAGHALTIVGYNDSIRYDYNHDGLYTNDVDINGDGVVDMKDWEIGGFIFANSYGDGWGNSGLCYAMYNSFAYHYGEGGIWNQTVNVLKVKTGYEPLLGIKLKLQHNSRNKLKIVAGVSPDTSFRYPKYIMDFPIVNYQGGNKVLQGVDTLPNPDQLELELDITSLLSYVSPDVPARFFIYVIERDAEGVGHGNILHFGLIDYTSDQETVCHDTPVEINNNDITTLSVVQQYSFDKPEILTEELPAIDSGVPYQTQLEAEGGAPPYKWTLRKNYSLYASDEEFPQTDGTELVFSDNDTAFVRLDLPFAFPYYGDTMHQIYVYIDGFVTFNRTYIPYPYFMGESTMLTDYEMIAPFLCNLEWHPDMNQKITYEAHADYVLIHWKVSTMYRNTLFPVDFALELLPTGEIRTYYSDMDNPSGVLWSIGVSSGDKSNYLMNNIENTALELSGNSFSYVPGTYPANNFSLSPDGLLEVSGIDEHQIKSIEVQVTDDNNISAYKTFPLSTGLLISYEINSGDDGNVDFGETTSLKAIVKNISSNSLAGVRLKYHIDDPYAQVVSSNNNLGVLLPGETKVVDSSLVLKISSNVPDQHLLTVHDSIFSQQSFWITSSNFTVNAPAMYISSADFNGSDWIDIGTTQTVTFEIVNAGNLGINNVDVSLSFNTNKAEVVGTDVQTIDRLSPGFTAHVNYRIHVKPWVASGTKVNAHFVFSSSDELISEKDYQIILGRIPVLLVNLDPTLISLDSLTTDLEKIGVNSEKSNTLSLKLSLYKSVFVLLGSIFNNHELSYNEGVILKNYLNEGGNVYMEGRKTWQQGGTPVHPLFHIALPEEQYMFYVDTLYSVPSDTITQKMMGFDSERPYIDYYLIPGDSAFDMLLFRKNDSSAVVACETDGYKTVASIVEYGALTTIDTIHPRTDYLNEILKFFGLHDSMAGVGETKAPSDNGRLAAYPNPFTDQLTFTVQTSGVGPVVLQVFNQHGLLVYQKTVSAILGRKGEVNIKWNGTDNGGHTLSAGVYIARTLAAGRADVTRIIHF